MTSAIEVDVAMTKRRLLRWSLILVALAAFAVWLEPTRVVWGWLRGEAFYQGRPTSYWVEQIRPWDRYFWHGGLPGTRWSITEFEYSPRRSSLAETLERWVNVPDPQWPAVLDGDEAAAAVLRELLNDSDADVRAWAKIGLSRIDSQEQGRVVILVHRTNDDPKRDLPGEKIGLFGP